MEPAEKPNIDKMFFWDWRYEDINWQLSYRSIIERVLERGTKEEIDEIVRYYGKHKIMNALKQEIKYLPDHIIEDAASYFDIKKEKLVCYIRKQSRKGHWI